MKYISRYIESQRTLIEESFGFVFEDKEGKNINRAEKWIKQNQPGILGKTVRAEIHGRMQDVVVTPRFVTQEVRNLVDNVKLADCKFLIGATRLYFDCQKDQHSFVSQMSKLNKILKIICISHADEYDYDLNGMSLDQLEERFGKAVQDELEADKKKMKGLSLKKRDDYKFVIIDTFEEAEKYGKYTEWCVTHSQSAYDTYTKDGIGRFYFCLQDGFEDVPKEKTEGCPLDAYGKSMIAVLVGDDGGLWHCTCRWNHANGGNDNIMTTEQISKLFGVDFYETFKPRSVEEVWKKLLKKREPDDDFCKLFGCIKTYDDETETFAYYKLIDKKIVQLVKVDDSTAWTDGKFVTMKDGQLVNGSPTSIKEEAFSNCTSLKSIVIPDSVKSIGDMAFGGCTSLTSISIPDSVESIRKWAFCECTSLKSIVIPDSVKSIGEWTFGNCISLTSIVIPDSVESIGNNAFHGCKSLTSISIPDSVKSIDNWAFTKCTSLTNIDIPDSVKRIGNYAFQHCKSLTSINIPDSVDGIGYGAFENCTSLTSIVIPYSVESIRDSIFYGCTSLKSIIFKGKTLEEVRSMAGYPWCADESIVKAEL